MHFRSVAFLLLGAVRIEASTKRKLDEGIQPSVSPDERPALIVPSEAPDRSAPLSMTPRAFEVLSFTGFFAKVRAPKALLPILTSDADFEARFALAAPLIGNPFSTRSVLQHWIQTCGLGLQIHALEPLVEAPCGVVGDELVLSNRMQRFLLGRFSSVFDLQPTLLVELDPSWSADRVALEFLAAIPGYSFHSIRKASKGKVVSQKRVRELREKLNALSQIPFGLHQVFVKARFAPARDLDTVLEVQRALEVYASRMTGSYQRCLAMWTELCLEPLHAWFSNPVQEMPCYFDETRDVMVLSASKRRSIVATIT